MHRRPRIDEIVAWRIEPRHPVAVLVTAVGRLLDHAMALMSLGPSFADPGGEATRPRLPRDVGEQLPLVLTVAGPVPWLPSPRWGPQAVRLTERGATVNATGIERRETLVPLERLVLRSLTPRRRYGRRRPASRWTAEVTDGDAAVTFAGTWLALAWLGHLAGWDEPPAAGAQ